MDGEYEISIPQNILIDDSNTTLNELINFAYSNIMQNMTYVDYFKDRTTLAQTLDVVDDINNHVMSIIPGDEKIDLSFDSICVEEGNMESQLDAVSTEITNGLNCLGLPPHKLLLRIECQLCF